jgi:hypothetical protein
MFLITKAIHIKLHVIWISTVICCGLFFCVQWVKVRPGCSFVDIGGIIYNHCLNFLFIINGWWTSSSYQHITYYVKHGSGYNKFLRISKERQNVFKPKSQLYYDHVSPTLFWERYNVFALSIPPLWKFESELTPHILRDNSLKLCMLAYYHMENRIWLQHFDWTIPKGVIAPFDLEYYIKKGEGQGSSMS